MELELEINNLIIEKLDCRIVSQLHKLSDCSTEKEHEWTLILRV